jgi:hypothetical protein
MKHSLKFLLLLSATSMIACGGSNENSAPTPVPPPLQQQVHQNQPGHRALIPHHLHSRTNAQLREPLLILMETHTPMNKAPD